MAEYAAGRCNIGTKGRAQRIAFGVLAIIFSLGLWGLIRLNAGPSAYVLVLFLPLFAGFVSLFEGLLGFCVVYGVRGTYDLR